MPSERPSFRAHKPAQAYNSPEELFGKLSSREQSHGYLRGPQQDALRAYLEVKDRTDIAMELPTGTGKTTVGLLVAEWRRRLNRRPVAYLTLTNQLATQVLVEAGRLGLPCADLRGRKEERASSEDGRFRSAQAIGVTTYSNLFNVKPVIHDADLLVFDDAHGGDQFVANMWTVNIRKRHFPQLYTEIVTALRPALSEGQYRAISEDTAFPSTELVDVASHSSVLQALTSVLDQEQSSDIRFSWTKVRNSLSACLFLVSPQEMVIRPLIAPTHTHEPFAEASQRIYMSATLSGEADLLRGYGVSSIKVVQAQHPQWGKRYLFMPSLYMDEENAFTLLLRVFSEQEHHRALLLAPSFQEAERGYALFEALSPPPKKLRARDVEEDLKAFTQSTNAVLALAGRYDGIDLPGDDCRLMIMWESPSAVGALERHQRERWKLGPLLRRRERTRLIQGLGRCTRDATDFAVVILLGQTMVDAFCKSAVVDGLPGEIQREIQWGRNQGETGRDDPGALTGMILGIMNDADYRREANESMEDVEPGTVEPEPTSYQESARHEVSFSRALWSGDYSRAYQQARDAADAVSGPELAGYRAWWLYLGSVAARCYGNDEGADDCLSRAKATGINAGFLDCLLRARKGKGISGPADEAISGQAETIWNQIDKLGWNGPKFSKYTNELIAHLGNRSDATSFHMGIESLGKLLGAETIRPTDDGAPDGVWIFAQEYLTFEAKAGKKAKNPLCKDDLIQAKGHPDWVRAHRKDLAECLAIPVVVPPSLSLDPVARPFAAGVKAMSADDLANWAGRVIDSLKSIRAEFSGKDYSAVQEEFLGRLKQQKLILDDVLAAFPPLSAELAMRRAPGEAI